MKFNWNNLLDQADNTQNYAVFCNNLEDLLSQHLDFEHFEALLKEIRIKTHYMSEDRALIWTIGKYFEILFTLDFIDFTKEVSFKTLESQILQEKAKKELEIKLNTEKSTNEKDKLLENLERYYNNQISLLKTTYKQKYNEWLDKNKTKVHDYSLLKIRLEDWVKANSKHSE